MNGIQGFLRWGMTSQAKSSMAAQGRGSPNSIPAFLPFKGVRKNLQSLEDIGNVSLSFIDYLMSSYLVPGVKQTKTSSPMEPTLHWAKKPSFSYVGKACSEGSVPLLKPRG